MQEMILLGAGASVNAGVPHSYDMTREIAVRFQHSYYPDHAHLIKFVIGGLLFQKGIRNEDPFWGVDVEELFNAVMLLADRSTLEAAPFIGSWHDMVEQFDRVAPGFSGFDRLNRAIYDSVAKEISGALSQTPSSFAGDKIDKTLVNAVLKTVENELKKRSTSLSSSDSVGRAVGDYLRAHVDKWVQKLKSARPSSSEFNREFQKAVSETDVPGEGQVYRSVSEEMIRMLKDIVWIEAAESAEYLTPLMKPLESQSSLVIATLNYDNSVELAAESAGCGCDTGIDRWSTTARFDMDRDGLYLLKLHGSIDWAVADGQRNPEAMPHQVIRRVEGGTVKENSYRPAVIFGQRNKLTAKGPFLDLLQAFRQSLYQADRLTVIGYSFRDEHINEYISQWMNASASCKLRVIDPGFDRSTIHYAQTLRAHCSDRLEVIDKTADIALPGAFGATS